MPIRNRETIRLSNSCIRSCAHSCCVESRGMWRKHSFPKSRCTFKLASQRPRSQSIGSYWKSPPSRRATQPATIRISWSSWGRYAIILTSSMVSRQKEHQNWETISSKHVVKWFSWISCLKKPKLMIVKLLSSLVLQACWISLRTTAGTESTNTAGSMETQSSLIVNLRLMTTLHQKLTSLSSWYQRGLEDLVWI